jgi:hypothetical protein
MARDALLPTPNRTSTQASSNRGAAAACRGTFRAAVRRRVVAIGLGLVAALVAGCGGGTRQDANEPSGTFPVAVVQASCPLKQHLARQARMVVAVKNSGTKTIPDVAVTVEPGFTTQDQRADLADNNRPVWIVDDGPLGGITATTNTWALGPLKPGATRRFVWKVTPVVPGHREIRYRIAAGLNGKALAKAANGDAAEGSFSVDVNQRPSHATVDPTTGKVVRDNSSTAGGG